MHTFTFRPQRKGDGRFANDLRSLVALALPIVAGLVCSALIGLVDSAVVAPLGHAALAAVSLTASVMLVFIATLYGLTSATGMLAAQAFGAGLQAAVSSHRRAGWRFAMATGLAAALLMGMVWPLLPLLGQPQDVLAIMPGYWTWSALTLVPLAILFAYKQLFDAIDRPGIALAVLAATVPLNAGLSAWFVHGGLGLPAFGLVGGCRQLPGKRWCRGRFRASGPSPSRVAALASRDRAVA